MSNASNDNTDRIDMGDDHVLVFAEYEGQSRVGCNIEHKKPDGTPCSGWLAFEGRTWAAAFSPDSIATWKVLSEDPLTLSPSVLCRVCGDHGFVHNGRWKRA